jgi:hypothetical protein
MYSIIDSMLSMKMDVYRQFDSQNSETGALVKEWNYHKTIPCHAKGVISNSATARSGDRQSFSNKYDNEQVIQIKTIEKITLREKVTNITDKNNNVIWEELNFPTSTPTVFEVVGTTPVTDPFGSVIAYNSVLKRSENQQIGQ